MPHRVAAFFLLSYPLIWLAGGSFFAFHVATLAIIAAAMMRGSPIIRRSAMLPAFLLVAYMMVYAASLAANASNHEASRIVAGGYNLTIWFMGLISFLVGSASNWKDWSRPLARISAASFAALALVGLLIIVAWYGLGLRRLEFDTPVSLIVERTGGFPHLMASSTLNILGADWRLGDLSPRTAALGPYATATAAMYLIFLPFYLAIKPRRLPGLVAKWVVLILASYAFYCAFSRLSMVAIIIGAAAWLVLRRRDRILLMAPLALAGIAILVPLADTLFESFNDVRAGSSETRFALYSFQIERVLEQSPLLGLGVKERIAQFAVPIGSHSTYFGALYKTGLIGLCLVVLFQLSILLSWLTRMLTVQDREARAFLSKCGVALIGMSVWMIGEDIDAPQMVAFAYFLIAGLVFSIPRRRSQKMGVAAMPSTKDSDHKIGQAAI